MANPSFDIYFSVLKDNRRYHAKVEITSRSENIIRFTIRAGTKEMKMEKYLFRKTSQWKLGTFNFIMGKNIKSNAMLIFDIQNAIDAYLKKEKL
jgi:hypothetical protein